MCLIIFGVNVHPRYSFVLAANRDEFYQRPTHPAAFWSDAPAILAGRDLAAGGTWLGITRAGRFAAVTNYREPFAPVGERSRGELVGNFLVGSTAAEEYLRAVQENRADYSGFNLLAGEFTARPPALLYYSNRAPEVKALFDGVHALSNHLLDTEWHKTERARKRFKQVLLDSDEIEAADLFAILADRTFAEDAELPDTGVGIERERTLSPAFIETNGYGTRSSTVLLIERRGLVHFWEKTFVGTIKNARFQFAIETHAKFV